LVRVHNAGKSQTVAGLMKDLVGDAVDVQSAGTAPGETVNEQSARSLAELSVAPRAERTRNGRSAR
jgi:arsenate-mycothiol transferase